MAVLNEIAERRSVRRFAPSPVSDEQILEILGAARLAPSSRNTQPWRFLVVRDEETKKRIVAADHGQSWMLEAPVFIVCLTDIRTSISEEEMRCPEDNRGSEALLCMVKDTGTAVGYMLLQIQHMGLAACWTGWFEQKDMRRAAGLPDNMFVSAVVPVGYPAEAPEARPRKAVEELAQFEKWE